MPGRMRHFLNVFVKKAWGRTLVSYVMPVLSAFFSGTLILELTTTDKLTSTTTLDWGNILRKPSFYVLLLLALITFVYNRACLRRETSVQSFLSPEYCKAYVLSECIPEFAEFNKRRIRDGKGGLKETIDELTKSVKLEPPSDEGE